MRIILAALPLLLCACHYSVPDIATVPDNPTYTQNVRPLFVDHCLFCHGSPPNRGAPATFRLDVYADSNGVPGAQNKAAISNYYVQSQRMPPAAKSGDGVGPNGLKMLQKWVDNGAPE